MNQPTAAAADDPIKNWEVKAISGKHFLVLDGIRGVAILMVVVGHTFYTNPAGGKISQAIGNLISSGWMGVPVFFVLSGFLISYPIFQSRKVDFRVWLPKGYAARRIGKILPPFYLSIAVFCIFYWIQFHDTAYFRAALNWAIGRENYAISPVPFNLPYWSLIVEAHFYIVLPLLFLATRGLGFRKTGLITVTAILVVPQALRQHAWPAGTAVLPLTESGNAIRYFVERFPFCVLDYFAFGMAFGILYVVLKPRLREFRHLSSLGYAGALLLAATLCFWAYASKNYGVQYATHHWSLETFKYLSAFSSFLLLFFIFDPECAGSRLLGNAWLRFIGIVSYEWFLFHGPVVEWFRNQYGHTQGSLLLYVEKTVPPLILTFLFSVAVYRWFSLPILNWFRKKDKPVG